MTKSVSEKYFIKDNLSLKIKIVFNFFKGSTYQKEKIVTKMFCLIAGLQNTFKKYTITKTHLVILTLFLSNCQNKLTKNFTEYTENLNNTMNCVDLVDMYRTHFLRVFI